MRFLRHDFYIVLLFSLFLAQGLSQAPMITNVFPDVGPKIGKTVVFIKGIDLGVNESDIEEIIVGGYSCKPTLYYESTTSLSCLAVYGTSEPENGTIVDGNVWIKTFSGGQSNSDTIFTFFDSCFIYSTSADCIRAGKYGGCKWCHYSTRCIESFDSCNEGECSTRLMRMSCGELAGIVTCCVILVSIWVLCYLVYKKNKDEAKSNTPQNMNEALEKYKKYSKTSVVLQPQDDSQDNETQHKSGSESEREEENEKSSLIGSGLSEPYLRRQNALERKHKAMSQTKTFTSFL